MIPEKVTWVRFPARINTVYSKLPAIKDFFKKILIKRRYLPQIFLQNIRSENFFSYALSKYSLSKQILQLYPQLFPFLMLIWPFQFQVIFAKLHSNCQLAKQNFPNNAFKGAEFVCIVGLTAVLCLLQRADSTFL